ncbi:MAG: ABC transporter permease [Trueperaceae bacterium]|nr:MAG: ABC transporter permease [Trueperaceae bacterium]
MDPSPIEQPEPARGRTLWARGVTRFFRNRLGLTGLVILLVFAALALLAPVIAPYGVAEVNFSRLRAPPSADHWLGTDELGRDTFTRVVYGARISLTVGLGSVFIALFAGSLLGMLAGFLGGWFDEVVMRVMDAMLSLPFLVLAIALAAILGPNLQNTILAIAIVSTPPFARLTRGQVLSEKERDYVQASAALGARWTRTLLRHILPNILSVIIVQASLATAIAVLAESALSFLGLGVQPPTPSWGSMLNTSRGYLATQPWMAFSPGIAIFLVVLALNLVGDGLRDAFDPRMRPR